MSDASLSRLSLVYALAAKTSGFITTAQLERLGVPASTVHRWARQGLLIRYHAGVYRTHGSVFDFAAALDLSAHIVSADQAVGARSALQALDLPGGVTSRVRIICPRGRRIRSRHFRSIESTDLRPSEIIKRGGHQLTTPLRSIIDSSADLSPDAIGDLLTTAVNRRLVTYEELELRCAELARRGRRGVRMVRAVLEHRLPPSKRLLNGYEMLVKTVLAELDLPAPEAQFPIEVNGRLFFVDFAWPQWKIFIECDSLLAHSSAEQLQRDLERQNLLVAAGWTPIRFTYWDVVQRPHQVVEQILAVCGRFDS